MLALHRMTPVVKSHITAQTSQFSIYRKFPTFEASELSWWRQVEQAQTVLIYVFQYAVH